MKNKHSLLLFAAFAFFSTANAQPTIKDQGTLGGEDYDYFTSMDLTSDGGVIVGGYSFSNITAQKTEKSKGGSDYWVVKIDGNKNIQWDKTIGSQIGDVLRSVRQTADGGYLLGGYSSGNKTGDKTESSKGLTDYWVVKLDANGNKQWDKTIGGSSSDFLNALELTADGGYILGGYSNSPVSGDKTANSKGDVDYWIVKLDAAGNIQWDKTIGGNNTDYLYALQQTADGGYVLGGYSNSAASGDKTANSRGDYDCWVVKLDAAGTKQWDKTIGGNGTDNLAAIEQTTDGGYIMGGNSNSGISGEKTENSKGYNDYWVVKLNAVGAIEWDKTLGGKLNETLGGLQQTINGGYILTGSSQSGISGDKTEMNRGGGNSYDYWVVKLNFQGRKQWDKTIGGSVYDYGVAVREIKKNDYLLGGYSNSRISGEKTADNRGPGYYYDYWLVELRHAQREDSTTVTPLMTSRFIAPQQHNTTVFSVYPNPATTVLHIQNVGKATFIFSDQSGKRMLSKTLEGNGDLNVANMPAGTYYLTNTATHATQKVVITK